MDGNRALAMDATGNEELTGKGYAVRAPPPAIVMDLLKHLLTEAMPCT